MFATSPSSGEAVGVSQCLSPTDSVFESKTELATVFNLAPIECEAVVVSAGEILDSASPNGTGVEP